MIFPKRHGSGNGEGSASFLKIKDGERITGILRGELYSFWQTGFGATAKIVEEGQGKERFRANFIVKEDGKYVAKIWEFGPKIYDQLYALSVEGWDLKNTLLTVSRAGATKENTKYTVTPQKKEPSASTMKAIEGVALKALEHNHAETEVTAQDLAESVDNMEVPF